MNHEKHTPLACAATMKLIGDYWTLRIIDALKDREARFCELQRNLDNLNPTTLTSRLKRLEDAKLVIRSEETVDKISVTYTLTTLGNEVIPIIKALYRFTTKAHALQPTSNKI